MGGKEGVGRPPEHAVGNTRVLPSRDPADIDLGIFLISMLSLPSVSLFFVHVFTSFSVFWLSTFFIFSSTPYPLLESFSDVVPCR